MRRLTIASVGLAVAAVAVLGFAAPAQAHDRVVASTPAEGETLTALPAEFSLTANETFLDLVGDGTGFGIQVTDAAGRYYGDGCVSIVDATMTTAAALGDAGAYVLTYQYVSSDSHTTSGVINFTWAPPADAEPSIGRSTAPVCGEAVETASPTPSPEPTMTTQETPAEPSATAAPAAASDSTSTLLWIGGAGLAVVIAIVATLLLVRPKKRSEPDGTE
jgi:methionine-rich copper-binding protein CopC